MRVPVTYSSPEDIAAGLDRRFVAPGPVQAATAGPPSALAPMSWRKRKPRVPGIAGIRALFLRHAAQ